MRKILFTAAGCLLALCGPARADEPAYTAEKTPPRIVRRTYDPQHPPAEMLRKLTLPEAGLCEFDFGCEIRTGTETSLYGVGSAEATVTSLRLVAHLDITIWTIVKSTPKLRAHEEGHREICEAYYRLADEVALRLARQAMGTTLLIAHPDHEKATTEAIESFQNKLLQEFLRETARRCMVAQARYDVITAHGLNPITESDAIAQALAAEQAKP